ncbi:hypothetical protein HK105_207734 [Polyrhizophydium stewartii]|uniref:Zn(2)-C6 fungal-type domain-containing protein n=1 Tax=Polyrhizophydium stewartii TaxID=2732419 RepID=A0ABR4MZN0_9FUNG
MRPNHTCQACIAKKRKCDRKRPSCSLCKVAGIKCVYEPFRRAAPGPQTPAAAAAAALSAGDSTDSGDSPEALDMRTPGGPLAAANSSPPSDSSSSGSSAVAKFSLARPGAGADRQDLATMLAEALQNINLLANRNSQLEQQVASLLSERQILGLPVMPPVPPAALPSVPQPAPATAMVPCTKLQPRSDAKWYPVDPDGTPSGRRQKFNDAFAAQPVASDVYDCFFDQVRPHLLATSESYLRRHVPNCMFTVHAVNTFVSLSACANLSQRIAEPTYAAAIASLSEALAKPLPVTVIGLFMMAMSTNHVTSFVEMSHYVSLALRVAIDLRMNTEEGIAALADNEEDRNSIRGIWWSMVQMDYFMLASSGTNFGFKEELSLLRLPLDSEDSATHPLDQAAETEIAVMSSTGWHVAPLPNRGLTANMCLIQKIMGKAASFVKRHMDNQITPLEVVQARTNIESSLNAWWDAAPKEIKDIAYTNWEDAPPPRRNVTGWRPFYIYGTYLFTRLMLWRSAFAENVCKSIELSVSSHAVKDSIAAALSVARQIALPLVRFNAVAFANPYISSMLYSSALALVAAMRMPASQMDSLRFADALKIIVDCIKQFGDLWNLGRFELSLIDQLARLKDPVAIVQLFDRVQFTKVLKQQHLLRQEMVESGEERRINFGRKEGAFDAEPEDDDQFGASRPPTRVNQGAILANFNGIDLGSLSGSSGAGSSATAANGSSSRAGAAEGFALASGSQGDSPHSTPGESSIPSIDGSSGAETASATSSPSPNLAPFLLSMSTTPSAAAAAVAASSGLNKMAAPMQADLPPIPDMAQMFTTNVFSSPFAQGPSVQPAVRPGSALNSMLASSASTGLSPNTSATLMQQALFAQPQAGNQHLFGSTSNASWPMDVTEPTLDLSDFIATSPPPAPSEIQLEELFA